MESQAPRSRQSVSGWDVRAPVTSGHVDAASATPPVRLPPLLYPPPSSLADKLLLNPPQERGHHLHRRRHPGDLLHCVDLGARPRLRRRRRRRRLGPQRHLPAAQHLQPGIPSSLGRGRGCMSRACAAAGHPAGRHALYGPWRWPAAAASGHPARQPLTDGLCLQLSAYTLIVYNQVCNHPHLQPGGHLSAPGRP